MCQFYCHYGANLHLKKKGNSVILSHSTVA